MDVSIIIVNYNTAELLKECINSINNQVHGVEYEIIVVDNGSTDNSNIIISSAYPEVVYINAGNNLGFGKANNLGAQYARGKYLFFLNSDTLLVNDAVTCFYEFASSNKFLGALGAILEDVNGDSIHSYGRFSSVKEEFMDCVSKYFRFLKRRDHLNPSRVEEPLAVDYITGADLFLPKETFTRMGGFDPDFFMYSEECDLQYRMKQQNLARLIIPNPRIIHLEGGSDPSKTRRWSFNRYYNMTSSKITYIKKHFSIVEIIVFRAIDVFFLTPIILVSKYKIKEKAKILKLLLFS